MVVDLFYTFRRYEEGKVLPDEFLRDISCEAIGAGAGEFDLAPDVGGIDDTADIIDQRAVVRWVWGAHHSRDTGRGRWIIINVNLTIMGWGFLKKWVF